MNLAIPDVQKPFITSLHIKIGVVIRNVHLFFRRQMREAELIMVAVTLAVFDIQDAQCRKILVQRHDRKVGKVFATHESLLILGLEISNE